MSVNLKVIMLGQSQGRKPKRKSKRMQGLKKFIYTNRIFFSIWSLWMLVNFALWARKGVYDSKKLFVPDTAGGYLKIGEVWNIQEVLIYGISPLILLLIFRFVFKKNPDKIKS